MYDPAPGSPYIEPIIFVEGYKLDVVHSFVYLGSTLSEGCSLDREISFPIERLSRSFSALNKRVWSQHGIKLQTKIIVYKVCILTALLCASETWTLYKHQLKLLEGFHQRCLRQTLHIKWQSHVSDTEVLGESRATKHPIDGNEKLSPMGGSHCAYGWRPSVKAIILWWNVCRREKCIKTEEDI